MVDNVPQSQWELQLIDAAATDALGAALARACPADLRQSRVLYLAGELGAGKTTCARSLLRALGVGGSIRSPTYTLVEVYDTPSLTCVHVDLYRLSGAADVDELGLRDYLDAPCLLMIEWPEKGGAALPAPDIVLALTYAGESRAATLRACSSAGRQWLDILVRDNSLTPYVSNLT